MKIWARISKEFLSYGRSSNGGSISYDGMVHGFNSLGVDCIPEYPAGDAMTAIRYEPPDSADYLHLWYGDPKNWDFDINRKNRGNVAYCRCGEAPLPRENLDLCDVVLVPTESLCKYHQANLAMPVRAMFGGYKPELFPQRDIDFYGSPFVFIHAGVTQWRKGSDKACAAFVKAFPVEQDVRLIVRSPGATDMFKELKETYAGDSRLVFDDIVVTDRRKVQDAYYGDAHCLLFPSIIEGAGRCLTEAMATGMPSIVSRTSAMVDYFYDDYGWWVETNPRDGYNEPDVDDMAAKLRAAYQAREECEVKGNNAAAYALRSMTWERGIEPVLPLLERIYLTKDLDAAADSLTRPLKLNMGCDFLTIDGWVNVDTGAARINACNLDKDAPEVFRHDIRQKLPFAENSVLAITISHVLYALNAQDVVFVMAECYRVLAKGCVLRITDVNSAVCYFPSSFYPTALVVMSLLEKAGFAAKEVEADETACDDKRICLDKHGGRPRVFFCEGVKL